MSSMGLIIIMSTIHITNKGRLMDTLEKIYIFREAKLDNQTDDKLAIRPNIKQTDNGRSARRVTAMSALICTKSFTQSVIRNTPYVIAIGYKCMYRNDSRN